MSRSSPTPLPSMQAVDRDKQQATQRLMFDKAESSRSSSPGIGRAPLFDDPPETSIPGNVHLIDDEALGRLIEHSGHLNLLRQMAKDLAERDAQITELRKRYEEREKRLKHMLYESGVPRSDVERRLATVLPRRPSRESVLSGKPRSEYSYVETLDEQLQEAMNLASNHESTSTHSSDSNRAETPRARSKSKPDHVSPQLEDQRSSGAVHSRVSTLAGHNRRGSILSRWSAGLFGWDTSRSKSDQEDNDWGDARRRSERSDSQSTIHGDKGRARGQSDASQFGIGSAAEVRNHETSLGSSIHSPRLDIWPDGREPLHFKAIAKAKSTKPPDLDDPTSEGWLVYKRASSTIANAAYGLVFEREPHLNDEESPPLASLNSARDADSLQSRIRSISVVRPHESWISPVLRDAQSVLPTSVSTKSFSNRNSTMELETFIPDADQPPTMLPAWNDNNLSASGHVFTDRFGFKLFDARSKRREATEQMYEATQTDGQSQTQDLTMSQDNEQVATTEVSHAKNPSTPLLQQNFDRDHKSGDNEDMSADPSTVNYKSGRNLRSLNDSAVSPRPLSPETSLNKSGATFSNEKSSARLLMLSQLDLYGADKAKQEQWNAFLKKTREDRRKADTKNGEWIDQNEDEAIGLASLGTGRMAKERRKELSNLVLAGIPMSYRPKIWGELTGALALKEPGYYQDLLLHGKDTDPICVDQIDLDLKRTMPSNVFFAGTGPGVPKLRRVLLAFSRHNADVGYCQGMNVIAATLLLTHPTEEDAFFVLVCIVEKILPARYFTPDLLTSRADQIVLKHIVKGMCPKTHKHLSNLGIDLEAITFGWFLSVFTDCLPAESLFRIWDIFFIEGHPYLLCVAVAIIKVQEKEIIKCESPGQVYTLLKDLKRTRETNIDELVKIVEQVQASMKNKGYDINKLQESAIGRLVPAES